MNITNQWAGYFTRSYEQIRDNVITNLQGQVPEMTDHTESNTWIADVSIWAGIGEMLGYYIDNAARETYITQCRLYESAVEIAKAYDYRIKAATPASVTLTFTSSIAATGDISIPQYTEVQTEQGVKFVTSQLAQISTGQTTVDVAALQQYQVASVSLGNSDGSADQIYEQQAGIVDGSVAVTVGSNAYTAQDTFAYSSGTDRHFIARINKNQKIEIVFGDGTNGQIPPSGEEIVISYWVTEDKDGEIGANLITVINSSITVPGSEQISVNNASQATGAVTFESLEVLRKRIPLSIRTKWRAVTEQDFTDLAELVNGVEKANTVFNCKTDSKVGVYISPTGGGTPTEELKTSVFTLLDERNVVGPGIDVRAVGLLYFNLTVSAKALPGFANLAVKNAIEAKILEYFSNSVQEISGNVDRGDIYEYMESATGADSTNLDLFLPEPYAVPVNSTTELNWTRAIKTTSTAPVLWLVRILPGAATFELFKDGVFDGIYNVGSLVDKTEVSFTITGSPVAGTNYEFYTYAYNQNVDILDAVLAASELSRLTVTVTGGV